MRRTHFWPIVALVVSGLVSAGESAHPFVPKEGFVPDAATAIQIAVAVWVPIYGRENIERQKPYHAELRNGVWFVYGTLPTGTRGGTAEAEIAKSDGRVLRVIHGK